MALLPQEELLSQCINVQFFDTVYSRATDKTTGGKGSPIPQGLASSAVQRRRLRTSLEILADYTAPVCERGWRV